VNNPGFLPMITSKYQREFEEILGTPAQKKAI
jgi:hypothetical protein